MLYQGAIKKLSENIVQNHEKSELCHLFRRVNHFEDKFLFIINIDLTYRLDRLISRASRNTRCESQFLNQSLTELKR